MRTKKIIIPTLVFLIIMVQFGGCSFNSTDEVVKTADELGDAVVIEYPIMEGEDLFNIFESSYGIKEFTESQPDPEIYITAELEYMAQQATDSHDYQLPENYEEQYRQWRGEYEDVLKDIIAEYYELVYDEAFTNVTPLTKKDDQLNAEAEYLVELLEQRDIKTCFDVKSDYIKWRLSEYPWVDTTILFKDISKKMWVSADCSVREKANKNSDKIGKLEMADQVKVTGEGVNACKGYYRIEFKGKTGYVKKTYLSNTKKDKPAKGDDKAISTVDKTTNNSGGNNSSGGNKNTGNSSGTITVNTDGGYAIGNGPSSGRGGDGGEVSGKGGSADVNPDIDTDRIH